MTRRSQLLVEAFSVFMEAWGTPKGSPGRPSYSLYDPRQASLLRHHERKGLVIPVETVDGIVHTEPTAKGAFKKYSSLERRKKALADPSKLATMETGAQRSERQRVIKTGLKQLDPRDASVN